MSRNLNFQAGIFVNHITNMIVETPGEFIYKTFIVLQVILDTLPALINSNVSKAILYGVDYKFEYNFYGNFVLYGSGSFVRGKDTGSGENLPLIPPLRGHLGIRYSYNRVGSAELTATGASKQTKIAAGEKDTDGYIRLDMVICSEKIRIGKT